MKPTLRWFIFAVLFGLLLGGLLLTQFTHGDRSSGVRATSPKARVRLPPATPPLSDAERARAAILAAARCHGIESRTWEMQNVVWRESRFDPKATGTHGEMGMCQFMAPLWGHAVRQMGQPGLSPWVPEDAAQVMAFCWAHGYRSHWRTAR